MTFKEKLQMEHPEKLDKHCGGGCEGCPCFYGYEETKWCGNTWGTNCEECWNREMPGTESKKEVDAADYIEIYTDGHKKGYDEGLNDAWELARKIYDLPCDELETILGVKYGTYDVLGKYSPQEALAKLKAYEEQRKLEVGDVVFCFADCDESWRKNEENYGVLLEIVNDIYTVLMKNGDVSEFAKSSLEKTGKRIDIKSILEQIRG